MHFSKGLDFTSLIPFSYEILMNPKGCNRPGIMPCKAEITSLILHYPIPLGLTLILERERDLVEIFCKKYLNCLWLLQVQQDLIDFEKQVSLMEVIMKVKKAVDDITIYPYQNYTLGTTFWKVTNCLIIYENQR